MPLPTTCTLPMLTMALTQAETALTPAPRETIAGVAAYWADLGAAFKIDVTPDALERITKVYAVGFDDIPTDLLRLATKRLTKTWKWGNRLPFPADFREAVAPELAQRTAILRKLQSAAWKARMEAQDREAAERRRAAVPVLRPGNGAAQPPLAPDMRMPREVKTELSDNDLPRLREHFLRECAAAGIDVSPEQPEL